MTSPILVLSGGNALGAYLAGAWSALEAASIVPSWVVGSSIGAVTAAIVAGNASGARDAALQKFWERARGFDAASTLLPEAMRGPIQYGQALASKSLGRPPLFTLRPPDLTMRDARPSHFDVTPMRTLIGELVDFERLNNGEMRVSMLAVDLASGQEVVFDTRAAPITLDAVMASAALIPEFPPVEIGGRLLVDGGLAANLPIHLALDDAACGADGARTTVFAVDLFPLAAPLPRGVLQAAQRQSDLIFASQTSRTLRAMKRLWRDRTPGADIFLTHYAATEEETALKGFDFSAGVLARRRVAGVADMRATLERWRACAGDAPGLTIHSDDFASRA